MNKIMFLFGAGASYGSDISDTPALGNDLFNVLQQKFPDSWGKLTGEAENKFKSDFEEGMVYLSNNHSQHLAPLQRAMAIYFFEIKLYSTNLYLKLAERFSNSDKEISCITLNYERLLETAINHANMTPCCGGSPRSSKEIEICYPHGCCHFFNKSVIPIGSPNVMIKGTGIHTFGEIEAIMKPDVFYNRIYSDPFPPVMSYFEPSKETLSGKNFIDSQRARYNQLISDSELIIIIGLKVRESDKHIWNPLSQTKAKIIYCSGADAGREYQNWNNKHRKSYSDEILCHYFSDGFDLICNKSGV